MLIIGITGMPGSGKGELTKMLIAKGFTKVRIGDAVIAHMKDEGIEVNNETLRSYTTRIKSEDPNTSIRWAYEMIPKDVSNVIFDGIRNPEEVEFLKRNSDRFYLIHVDAKDRIRFKRLTSRGREDDFKTMEEFRERDRIELGWGLGEAIELADFVVHNDTSLEALKDQADMILKIISE